MFDIQKEIDLCASSGGGTVTVPPGEYHCGTIFLRSKVHLVLSENTVICGSPRLADYPAAADGFSDGTMQERGRALILGENVQDSGISGSGTITGNGAAFSSDDPCFGMRPMLVRFYNSRDIKLSGIRLREPASWTCHLRNCENVEIDGLDIYSHVNSNNDGIDIDSCRNVIVRNCKVDSGDDAVCLKSTAVTACENITISGCTLSSIAAAFKVGTESYGDIRKVTLRDCHIVRGNLGAIKILSTDGAVIEDFLISSVKISQAGNPFFVRLGDRGRCYGDVPGKPAGRIRRITLENVQAEVTLHPERILSYNFPEGVPLYAHNCPAVMGLPGNPVEEVVFRNVSLVLPGGMDSGEINKEIPEFSNGYPEIGYYGVLPASSVYLRHVDGVEFTDFSVKLSSPDIREQVVFEDARNISGI